MGLGFRTEVREHARCGYGVRPAESSSPARIVSPSASLAAQDLQGPSVLFGGDLASGKTLPQDLLRRVPGRFLGGRRNGFGGRGGSESRL